MAVTPNALVTPLYVRSVSAIVTGANSTYSGTSLPANLVAIGGTTNGSLLRSLKAIPLATVTATQLQLFKWNGTANILYLVDTALMPAYTMAQTTQAAVTDFGYTDSNTRYLGPGSSGTPVWTYYVGIGVAMSPGIAFTAEFGDY